MTRHAAGEITSIEKILRAAEAEFGLHGLDSVSIGSIAKQAGISTQLIYHYFTRKEALYAEILVRVTDRFFRDYRPGTLDPSRPVDTIHQFARSCCGFYQAHPHTGRLLLDQVLHGGEQIKRDIKAEAVRGTLLAQLDAALQAGVAAGVVRSGISAEGLFFLTLVLTIGYTSMTGLLDGIHLDVPELRQPHDVVALVADAVVGAISPLRG